MYLLSGSASNIATKINAKLSTIYDKAVSWKSCSDESRGIEDLLPWGESSHKKYCLVRSTRPDEYSLVGR